MKASCHRQGGKMPSNTGWLFLSLGPVHPAQVHLIIKTKDNCQQQLLPVLHCNHYLTSCCDVSFSRGSWGFWVFQAFKWAATDCKRATMLRDVMLTMSSDVQGGPVCVCRGNIRGFTAEGSSCRQNIHTYEGETNTRWIKTYFNLIVTVF